VLDQALAFLLVLIMLIGSQVDMLLLDGKLRFWIYHLNISWGIVEFFFLFLTGDFRNLMFFPLGCFKKS
jgi:hypothetical protein